MSQKIAKNSFVEIDLDRIKKNAAALRNLLGEDTGQLVVIKADGYGHGAVEVAETIEQEVDWFAVNSESEGIELREASIEAPILVFGVPDREAASAYRDYRLTATVSAIDHFDRLPADTRYHLNFDSGMGRLGLLPDQVSDVKAAMGNHPTLKCTGIYSHFATTDDPGSRKAAEQIEVFRSVRSEFDESLLTHMANTGATAFYPESHFDMVRTGIGVYGYAPGATIIDGLEPALRWRSRLIQVKPVKKGQSVSYGARWRCRENGYIGILPVGYEDGIPRILSGYLEIAIEDRKYPVVGTITMNYMMVDLSENPREFEAGQPVDIMGGGALTADTWADRADTIPYEILTGIPGWIERRYLAGTSGGSDNTGPN